MEMFILLFFVQVSFSFAEGIDVKSETMIFDYQKKSSNSLSITSEATTNLDNKIFISEKIKTEIPFTDIGIHWDAEYQEGSDLLIEIKTSKDGESWTEWKKIIIESYPDENPKNEYFSALINIEQNDRVHSYIQ